MKKAFTLVELIVVVTILAILWAIWFVSYNWYLSWVRDTNRTSQLTSIHDWLELYRVKKDLPTPDNALTIKSNTQILGYQWYVWTWVLNTIEFVKWWKDPKDNTYYTYYLDDTSREFQLMAYLEDEENTTYLLWWIVERVEAATDYKYRYPVVYWKKLWILVDNTTNSPIQETLTWTLDLWSGTWAATTYKVYFKNDNIFTSSWTALVTKIKDNRTTVTSSINLLYKFCTQQNPFDSYTTWPVWEVCTQCISDENPTLETIVNWLISNTSFWFGSWYSFTCISWWSTHCGTWNTAISLWSWDSISKSIRYLDNSTVSSNNTCNIWYTDDSKSCFWNWLNPQKVFKRYSCN